VGISVTEGITNVAVLNGVLWFGNGPNYGGPGLITINNDTTGSPAFVNPDAGNYHIGAGSAAIDHGVNAGVATDLDGITRPQGSLPDLGAYEAPYYTLTVATSGTGIGGVTSSPPGINCPSGPCANNYVTGTVVTLSASPSITSTFTRLERRRVFGHGTCVVTMSANTNVTANFAAITRTLSVALAGSGAGSVTSAPGTINCPTGLCANDYVTARSSHSLLRRPSLRPSRAGAAAGCSGTGTWRRHHDGQHQRHGQLCSSHPHAVRRPGWHGRRQRDQCAGNHQLPHGSVRQ